MTLDDLFLVDRNDPNAWKMEKFLGGLAKWWLCPDYYEERGDVYSPPNLPMERGFCPILIHVKNGGGDSLSRRALILPVRWTEITASGTTSKTKEKLPGKLIDLARRVQCRLREEGPGNDTDKEQRQRWDRLDRWRLIPAIDDFPNLSSLSEERFSWESATIPLAASLLLTAIDEELPKPGVFSSGAWNFDESHMGRITGVSDKFEAAATGGGTLLFLPEEAFIDASLEDLRQKGGPRVFSLPSGRRSLRDTVELYRRALCREPEEDDPEKCQRYYLNMPNDPDALHDFYRRRLTDAVALRCRNTADIRYPEFRGRLDSGILFSWISAGAELVQVAEKCFCPKKIVLFYTEQMRNKMIKCRESLAETVEVEAVLYNEEMRFVRLKEFLKSHLSRYTGERLLFDLTLGTVVMSLALQDAAPRNSILLYWFKEQGKNNRILPLSTEPEIRIKT